MTAPADLYADGPDLFQSLDDVDHVEVHVVTRSGDRRVLQLGAQEHQYTTAANWREDIDRDHRETRWRVDITTQTIRPSTTITGPGAST